MWRATDQTLQQTIALKRVALTSLGNREARLSRERALREARLAARLRGHPHVISVYDVLVDDGGVWLVMEYLPSRSLRELLNTHVVHRPALTAADANDMYAINVDAPLPQEQLCALVLGLVAVVEEKLSG